jgi:hypothetical protein
VSTGDTTLPDTDILAYSVAALPLRLRVADMSAAIVGLSSDLRDRLEDLMRPFVRDATDDASGLETVRILVERRPETPWWTVSGGALAPRRCYAPDSLLRYVEWLAVAQPLARSTSYMVIHGAALARDGATILLVGESGAGKTTVTVGLLQRGWLPLGDDLALISRQSLAITPFPRCFHADVFTAATIEQPALFAPVGALKGYVRPRRWAEAPVRVSCLARLTRQARDAAPASAQSMTQAEGAGAALQAAVRTGLPRREVARVAVGVAAGASCWQVNNGALHDTLDTLERLACTGRRI